MPEQKSKSSFELMDQMEKDQNLQFKDETYITAELDELDWRKKRKRLAALGMPWGVVLGMFIVWLTSIIDLPEWVSDAGLAVTGIGFIGFIVSIVVRIRSKS